MDLWRFLEGYVVCELTGADVIQSIYRITECGVRVERVEARDELTAQFRCMRKDLDTVRRLCEKKGDKLCICHECGIGYEIRKLIRRPVFAVTLALLFLLTAVIPTRILFLQVEGNESLTKSEILEAAELCGIHFGASRRTVRSEKMKNALLETVPQLQWAGINTFGCTAVISVRERCRDSKNPESAGIAHIVSAEDGYITSCTVTKGQAMCKPGDTVHRGQLLISGYTDCGICIQATQASGEVIAETSRDLWVVSPAEYTQVTYTQDPVWRIGFIFGKKRINLWKGSGISPVTCDRMYKEYHITLPGGFRLPVSLCIETVTERDTASASVRMKNAEPEMKTYTRHCISGMMVAGKILSEKFTVAGSKTLHAIKGNFHCSEMIGRVVQEEIGEINGKNS